MDGNRRARSTAFRPGQEMLEGRQLLSAASVALPSMAAQVSASASAARRITAQGTLRGTYRIDPPPVGTADLPNTIVLNGAGRLKGPGGQSARVTMQGELVSGGFTVPNAIQNGEIRAQTPFGSVRIAISGRFSRLAPGGKVTANASIIGGDGQLGDARGIGTIVISLGANQAGAGNSASGPATFVFNLRTPIR